MKLQHILIYGLVIIGSFTACKKNTTQPIIPLIEFDKSENTAITLQSEESIILNPKIIGQASKYEWLENGKVIGAEKIYAFNRETPGEYTLVFKVTNEAGNSAQTYKIKVIGAYAKGVLLLSSTNKNGTGNANISYIDENGNLKLDVFGKANAGSALSASAMSFYRYNNKLYVTSSTGPNHIAVLNDESLKLDYNITQVGISAVTYFATTDGKTGYLNFTNRKKPGLFAVDLTTKIITSTAIEGTTTAALLPIANIEHNILIPSAKQLLKIENNTSKVLYTYTENVAGVVKTANKTIWVGVQGLTNKPKFIKLDANLAVLETVELENTFKLPANGILTASGNDEYIYWQETSTGTFCRFNTLTKKAEEFVNPYNVGLSFSTAWKVNPQNGDVYIIDSPGIFSGTDSFSDLYIFDNKGKLKKDIKKVGYQVVDIVFPKY